MFRRIFNFSLALLFGISLIAGIELAHEERCEARIEKRQRAMTQPVPTSDTLFSEFTEKPSDETQDNDRCNFSSIVAKKVDSLLYTGSKTIFRKPVTSIWTRSLSVVVYPFCAMVDTACYTANGVYAAIFDPSGNAEIYFRKAGRCLLGAVCSPAGIIYPDLVTQHFVPKKIEHHLVRPYGKLYSAKALELYPKSPEDLQKILSEAHRLDKKVTFAGALMSQGRQALPHEENALIIHFAKLNNIHIDPEAKIATVGAGTTWQELQEKANQYGFAVKVAQASNIFSVGGSLSANCHGWDHKAGSLINTVNVLTVVTADGEIKRLSPDDELFTLVIGGYGGFAAIVEAELQLTDNVELQIHGVEVPPEAYVDYFKNHIVDNDNVNMHYYRLSLEPKKLFETGIAVNYEKTGQNNIVTDLIDEPTRGRILDRIELQILRRLKWSRKAAWNVEKKSALAEGKTSRNEAMRPPINAIINESKIDAEWLQEYFVPAEELSDFLTFLKDVLEKNDVLLLNASVRFVKKDTLAAMPYAKNSDMFAVVLFFNQSQQASEIEKTRLWVRQVIDYLNEHHGTFYLPYQQFATRQQFRQCYPEWEEIAKKKLYYDKKNSFYTGLYAEYFFSFEHQKETSSSTSMFRSTLADQREGIRDFLNNVLMQLDEEKFFTLLDAILDDTTLGDEEIYAALNARIEEARPSALQRGLLLYRSLQDLKADISGQVAHLLDGRIMDGYVEIGYPGRLVRPIESNLTPDSPIYVVTDQERLSDYVQSGFPRPYDRFVPLNDYDPIKHESIPSESVDLVACYIGLHHAPEEKLDGFLASIYRILRPGGIFILMDHDADTEELQEMVDVVHSIFNVANGVSEEENIAEYRNFRSLEYWTKLVGRYGLERTERGPLVRKGDSTRNSLIAFRKTPHTHSEVADSLKQHPDYKRPGLNTYLTAPEWYNVRVAQAYGEFIEHTPFYAFPYFSEICNYWKVFGNSWNAAREDYSFWEVSTSEYTMMSLFIGVSMTVEFTAKGLISSPMRWIFTSEAMKEAEVIHMCIKAHDKDISAIDSRIGIVETFPEAELQYITVPRYTAFTEILKKFAANGIDCSDIAGHQEVQLDVIGTKGWLPSKPLPQGCKELYRTPLPSDGSKELIAYKVNVPQLSSTLQYFGSEAAEVSYIHDF